MALTIYAYTRPKHAGGGKQYFSGIQCALFTVDPALAASDTAAERKALVAAAVNSLMGVDTKAADYPNEIALGAAAGSGMATDGDLIVVHDYGVEVAIT